MKKLSLYLLLVGGNLLWAAQSVRVDSDHLLIDERPASFLFGAEIQYFRARGGPGPNVPRATVLASWTKLLDRVQEAKMNSVIFYIPWDFHEPVEGVFDFTGTLDRDGDGNPDYPSRDLKTFIKMIRARNIKHVMVRPGPYINAEWGPTGFGAIPHWFLKNYPDSLTQAKSPHKPLVASYQDPVFRERTRRWFSTLYKQVLKDEMGPNSPIHFLQLDNETNYFWDSVYERDYHPQSLSRYRDFLLSRYGTQENIFKAYGKNVSSLSRLPAPKSAEDRFFPSPAWHYDWFLFHDVEIKHYYEFLRNTWIELGIGQDEVLFTSCDSFNAFANGLLPRLDMRQKAQLSLSTMNIYPKTYGKQSESTLNRPMKAAHDARLMASSHRAFYGAGENWVMSTETVGGWFPPTEVSLATRQHTYGSLMASGVKALIIYYFHEGWNWSGEETHDSELHFDAPLDKNMNPRPAFHLLKSTGTALRGELGKALVNSKPARARILIARDSTAQYPVVANHDAIEMASNGSAAWFGLLREAGYAVDVDYVDVIEPIRLADYSLVIWNPPGYASPGAISKLTHFANTGGKILSYVDPLLGKKVPNLLQMKENLALGWNHDHYPHLSDAQRRLDGLQSLLVSHGLKPEVSVKVSDNQPYLHVWSRDVADGMLVAVENFKPTSRTVKVRIANLDPKKTYEWQPWYGTGGGPVAIQKSLGSQAVTLMSPPDGIQLWHVTAQ